MSTDIKETKKEKAVGRVKTGINWDAPNRLKLKKSDKNFTYRLCDKDNEGSNQDQGYITLDQEELERVGAPKSSDGVWMKLPKELGDSRDKHYEEKNKKMEQATKSMTRKEGNKVAVDSKGHIKPFPAQYDKIEAQRLIQKKKEV